MNRIDSAEMADLIVFDLEATCWQTGSRPDRMETIEIGAVRVDGVSWDAVDEFGTFIRPVAERELSPFCTGLTSIRQEDVDGARTFPAVFAEFIAWAERDPVIYCSWGAYDLRQFRVDCRRHGLEYPATLQRHVNLKKAFAAFREARPCGMKKALGIAGLPLMGTHHRGIDDARNIAAIAVWLLRQGWRPEV